MSKRTEQAQPTRTTYDLTVTRYTRWQRWLSGIMAAASAVMALALFVSSEWADGVLWSLAAYFLGREAWDGGRVVVRKAEEEDGE